MQKQYLFCLFIVMLTMFGCNSESKESNSVASTQEAQTALEKEDTIAIQRIAYTTDLGPVDGQEIEYATASTKMNGYLAFNPEQKEKRPGVLVIHEWWGHNDYARGRANMLADLGYVALAVDMYGNGQKADHPEDAGKFSAAVFANMDEARARFESALALLKSHPMVDSSSIAAIGYCFGGSVALTMANLGYDLDAVAAFHSGITLPAMPSEGTPLTTKVLVANGSADPFINIADVANWSKAMDAAGADYEYVAYPETKHAFTDPGATEKGLKFSLPLAYDKDSDIDAWAKLQLLLIEAFKK